MPQGYGHDLGHGLRGGQFLDRAPGIAAQKVIEVALQDFTPASPSGHAQFIKHIGQPPGVLPGHSHPHAQQRRLQPVVQPPHHAEVNQRDGAVWAHEEVAGVRVGMEETELEHLAQHHADRILRESVPVNAGLVQRGHVGDFYSAYAPEGQHAAGGQLPVHAGNVHSRVTGEVAPEAIGALALALIVQFVAEGIREFVHQGGEIIVSAKTGMRLGPLGNAGQDFQIFRNLLGDAGALDFHDNGLAVLRDGRMRLPDRGGGERL